MTSTEPMVVTCRADEKTRTLNSACHWIAEATVDGQTYIAGSRHGAPNELAQPLVAAGISDRPMAIRYRGLAGTMAYRSFHATATSTTSRPAREVLRSSAANWLIWIAWSSSSTLPLLIGPRPK